MYDLSGASNQDLDRIIVAREAPTRPFKLYGELEATSKKIWLVKNLLGAGEASATYGAPGSGKSALVEDMALHIAAGREWLGRPVMGGSVVYVALERAMLVQRRAIAFRVRHEIEDLPFAIVGGVHDFREARTANEIASIVRQVEDVTNNKTVLIVMDTVSRALAGGDENSSKDMGAIVNATSRLQEATGAHVQWVHHVPVDGGERMRGHGALLGALDTTINVEKLESVRVATVVKANDSEEGERISFNLESVTIGEETTAPVVVPTDEVAPAVKQGPRLTKNQDTMLTILRDAMPFGLSGEAWNAAAREAGIGVKRRADLVDVRLSLKSKGLVKEYADRWTVRADG